MTSRYDWMCRMSLGSRQAGENRSAQAQSGNFGDTSTAGVVGCARDMQERFVRGDLWIRGRSSPFPSYGGRPEHIASRGSRQRCQLSTNDYHDAPLSLQYT